MRIHKGNLILIRYNDPSGRHKRMYRIAMSIITINGATRVFVSRDEHLLRLDGVWSFHKYEKKHGDYVMMFPVKTVTGVSSPGN